MSRKNVHAADGSVYHYQETAFILQADESV